MPDDIGWIESYICDMLEETEESKMYEGGYGYDPNKVEKKPSKIVISPSDSKQPKINVIEFDKKKHTKNSISLSNKTNKKVDENYKHQVSIIKTKQLPVMVGNPVVSKQEVDYFDTTVDLEIVRNLLSKINLMDTKSIMTFGNDFELSSRIVVDEILDINLKEKSHVSQNMKEISLLVKDTFKSRGIFEIVFGFEDKKSIENIISKIEDYQKKIEKEIPLIFESIEKVEQLFLESKNKIDYLNAYIVALKLAIKQFTNEDISWADELTQQMIQSNIRLLEKRIISFTSTKLTLASDPLVIFNMRDYYVSLISSYQDSIKNLIHDWKNSCSIEIQSNKRKVKKTSMNLVSIIETTIKEK